MHDNKILIDWAFSSQEVIKQTVENTYPNEIHRWPLLRHIRSKGYVWKNKIIIVLYSEEIGTDYMGLVEDVPFPILLDDPKPDNIESWHEFLLSKFALSGKDFVIILPMTEGNNATERWNKFVEPDKELWRMQINMNVRRQYYYLKGFDAFAGFFIPPGYSHLTDDCQNFFVDHPNYSENVFIMMKFDEKITLLTDLTDNLRSILRKNNLNGVRADDKMYLKDRDLWNNVCVYMLCCKFGIAILENVSAQEYNPNVALEYGFMRALDKPVLLLADENFPMARADVVGKVREYFRIHDITNTLHIPVEKWVKEIKKSNQ